MKLNRRACEKALKAYNEGTYRSAPNVELDSRGYELFRTLNFQDRSSIFRCVLFAGRDYGGAQLRFLPEDGYEGESRRIARRILKDGHLFEKAVRGGVPLIQLLPDRPTITQLFEAFEASKRWPVWASKFLHFAAPDVFAILDSRTRCFFDIRRPGSDYGAEYLALMTKVRQTLMRNEQLLCKLMEADPFPPPSLLKLLDKVAFSSAAT